MSDASTIVQTSRPPALSAHGISKRFPGVVANADVDFEAATGEVHALLGENGAGKTTLMNILTGLYQPDEGEIRLGGERVAFRTPKDAIDAGIGMVHQHFRLVDTLTVAQNLVLASRRSEAWLGRRAGVRLVRDLAEALHMPIDPDAYIWQLSVGEQQRVEIMKAVVRGARVLILDEPTAVLTPQEVSELFRTLETMAREGHAVIVITHKLHEVLAVADRITVLRGGRSVAAVAAQGATPQALASLMVGREIESARRSFDPARAIGDAMLEVKGLSALGDRGDLALQSVDLTLRAGEIVGIAGVAGNGQRELAETITGLRPARAGTVAVAGRLLANGDPRDAISRGVAHVPEDRLHTGVAPSLSIADNLVLKAYRRDPISRGPLLRPGAIRARAVRTIAEYDVKAPGPRSPARQLSGGNLQKIVLAREFATEPSVLIAASPTRGLDVGAIETVHRYLRQAAAAGVAVLLLSEDLDEVRVLADRIAVMFGGRIVGEVDPVVATVDEIGLLMAGVGK